MNKFKSAYKANKQAGFTLIELLISLGIIAVLAIGVFIIYPKVEASSRAQTESTNISTIAAGVKALYAASGDYSTLKDSVVIGAKIYPSTMVNAGGTAAHSSWQSLVSTEIASKLPAGATGGALNNYFEITYKAVPSDICTKLASGVGSNFEDVLIGGASVFVAATGTAPAHIDPGAAATACTGAATSDMIFITN